ncbi:pilus assembly protein [Fulvimonas sp. R45]|uniref:TadE/TadG family type IV pilus assembly protein n=1 Tax=Fulvimonas sp. R45 TaxID=3045937 RepID=UPI00265E7ADA|nr:TadE/TadG family type IV pilus assembly protein [Fulvimonas sp. R45]MDO1528436.1 pilus assembly protein [Fulvimonas sp. R45]
MNISTTTPHSLLLRHWRKQRGVVAIEFALVFLFGMVPLVLFTLSGVLIFAAKQSLTLAAANGARAALHYGTDAQRQSYACQAAQQSMQWLITFSGETPDCSSAPITVSAPAACASGAPTSVQCITVTTSFDYDDHPFLPGTKTVYGWVIGQPLSSTATIQIDTSGG